MRTHTVEPATYTESDHRTSAISIGVTALIVVLAEALFVIMLDWPLIVIQFNIFKQRIGFNEHLQ